MCENLVNHSVSKLIGKMPATGAVFIAGLADDRKNEDKNGKICYRTRYGNEFR